MDKIIDIIKVLIVVVLMLKLQDFSKSMKIIVISIIALLLFSIII